MAGVLIVSILGGLGALIFSLVHRYYVDQTLKNLPQVYVFETYRGPVNPAVFVEDEEYTDDLVLYYQQVEKGENPAFHFVTNILPADEPVYLVGYSTDSLVAEIISRYDFAGGNREGSFTNCYVYGKTIHISPPELNSY